MRKTGLLLVLMCCSCYSFGTHIVGGEFEIEHISGYDYQIRMILYFDNYYGNPGAEDPYAFVGIFSKKDNALVNTVTLINVGSEFVEYTNPECVIASLSTRKILYRQNISLSPLTYNDPEGYYVVWERCCRNNVINNIVDPEATAQTFYLEFPPVVSNGEQFINSSPTLFPPLSDYACLNREFYADFTGIDKDGDSLVYSLTEPWSGGHTSPSIPALNTPQAGPYTKINWAEGIDMLNMVPGNPSLQISGKGILKVNAKREGLFVFAVKCEEFRNGKKIGEVRRDFQMLVIDCHEPGLPPHAKIHIEGRPPTDMTDTIRIAAGEEGCFKMYVNDPDIPEKIRFRASPVNFSARLNNVFSTVSGTVTSTDSPLVLDLCLPECPLTNEKYAIIDLIAMDDECSVPLTDTVRLVIEYLHQENPPPYFNFTEDTINYEVEYGKSINFSIEGIDLEKNSLKMDLIAENFNINDFGIGFNLASIEKGSVIYNFSFKADCQTYNFDTSAYQMKFLLTETDDCGNVLTSKMVLNIKVVIPENTPPEIHAENLIKVKIGESLNLPISATDDPNDLIVLSASGVGFDLAKFGIGFETKMGKGNVTSNLVWNPNCSIKIENQDEYTIQFSARDDFMCQSKSSSTSIKIQVLPPNNEKPQIINQFDPVYNLQVGDVLEFDVMASDQDHDYLYLDLINRKELIQTYGIEFDSAHGFPILDSKFKYISNCSHLGPNLSPIEFDLAFFAFDNKCHNIKGDTVTIKVVVSDIPSNQDKFLPANVFTPNNDQFNPLFTMPTLPNNNCNAEFMNIKIYNRWGKQVFYSEQREFAWDGGDFPTGVYYYVINFTNYQYKGTVNILK